MPDPLDSGAPHLPAVVLAITVDVVVRVATCLIVLYRKGDRPQVATAWIVLLLAFPIVGIVAYLLLGETWLGWRRRRRHAQVLAALDRPENHAAADRSLAPQRMDVIDRQISALATEVSGSGPVGGNAVRLEGDSGRIVSGMIADIDRARHDVHLLTYIWLDDRVGQAMAAALKRAVSRGVQCRVLVDGHGSSDFLDGPLCQDMRAHGVRVVAALPVHILRAFLNRADIRNHRKITVVDGSVGWIGSMNIAAPEFAVQPRYAPWVDCMVRIEGPVVRELELIFAEDWALDSGEMLNPAAVSPPPRANGAAAQVVATGPNFQNRAMTDLMLAASQLARQELVLTTPYFVPDPSLVATIEVAARRGTTVHLVLPRRNNSKLVALASRALYHRLLAAGVHVHEFRGGLLHTKTVTIDQRCAIVTSANLDRRSFEINFEASAILYDDAVARELRALQQSYIDCSSPVRLHEWEKRPLARRLMEYTAALFSPLL
jgi:cardiolipin synthase